MIEIESGPDAEAPALGAGAVFGRVLRSTPEFAALSAASEALQADAAAQAAIAAYDRRAAGLRVEIALRAVSQDQRTDLTALQEAVAACPSVGAYVAARDAFAAVCREASALISGEIGIDFAANCRAGGCCG